MVMVVEAAARYRSRRPQSSSTPEAAFRVRDKVPLGGSNLDLFDLDAHCKRGMPTGPRLGYSVSHFIL